ncbi:MULTISPECIES: SDR family NAD(P)-dependent oxidoreductase [Actinomycetes]|uniref:SDR family NAD(P)-dependent oxidoreductase n=2 Tax=Actinomycetes TaxID=1760 RepID=A0ABP6M4S4_9MICC
MARILITGSTDGLGRIAAEHLQAAGHHVTVHARDDHRRASLRPLVDDGASAVVGDLADREQVRDIVAQAEELGGFDAVIHNAGVLRGAHLLPVNVVAPYLLTALLPRPRRLIILSSGLHHGGHPALEGLDWAGEQETATYADTKLMATGLAAAVERRWPETASHAVDPGWVPTRMGGASATGDLREGTRTQEWLAVTADAAADVGGYWHHRRREEPHAAVHDEQFQGQLLAALAQHTGVTLA